MAKPFVHLELNTPDLAKAKLFYAEMFGWTFHDADVGGGMIYSTFRPESGPAGGLTSLPDAPTGWLAYIGVDDINTATEKAKSLGAEVVVGAQVIPEVGWMTIMKDPTGARIAMFQPKM